MRKKLWISLAISIIFCGIKSAYGDTIQKVKISNVRDTQVTISWITDEEEVGFVNYGTTTQLSQTDYDDRGSQTVAYTHHVTITGIMPETTYYYQIICGSLTSNIGSVTTGTSILPVGSDVVYGKVYKQDGKTPAKGAICYIRIEDADGMNSREKSQAVSVLVDENGYWFTELVNFREARLTQLFKYSDTGDNLSIYVEGGNEGSAEQVINTANDSPAQDIVMVTQASCL